MKLNVYEAIGSHTLMLCGCDYILYGNGDNI